MLAVTLDDDLQLAILNNVNQNICKVSLHRRMKVNLRLFQDHDRTFGQVSAKHKDRKNLRNPKTDISKENLSARRCLSYSHLIVISIPCKRPQAKRVD